MKKVFAFAFFAMATSAMASVGVPQAPEIDANAAASAVALLSGALMMLRSRRK